MAVGVGVRHRHAAVNRPQSARTNADDVQRVADGAASTGHSGASQRVSETDPDESGGVPVGAAEPFNPSGRVTIRLSVAEWRQVSAAAGRRGMRVSQFVRQAAVESAGDVPAFRGYMKGGSK